MYFPVIKHYIWYGNSVWQVYTAFVGNLLYRMSHKDPRHTYIDFRTSTAFKLKVGNIDFSSYIKILTLIFFKVSKLITVPLSVFLNFYSFFPTNVHIK